MHVAVMKARLTPDAHTEVSAAQFRLHLFVEVEVLTAATAVLIEMLLAHNLLDFFSNLGRQFVIVLSGGQNSLAVDFGFGAHGLGGINTGVL